VRLKKTRSRREKGDHKEGGVIKQRWRKQKVRGKGEKKRRP
jgi:hypothetical protein